MVSEQKSGSIIVTGASRGIGAAIARLVGVHGYPVAVNFTSDEAAAEEIRVKRDHTLS